MSSTVNGPIFLGYLTILCLLGGVGTWGVGAELAGAVVARGTVKVENERQVVQHRDGGVVGSILVRDGDQVAAGDLLVRLDDTFLRSELVLIENQLLGIYTNAVRLVSERDGMTVMSTGPVHELSELNELEIKEQLVDQQSLFDARLTSFRQTQRALSEQRSQIDMQIAGYEAQLESLNRQQRIVEADLQVANQLSRKRLIEASRISVLERELARVTGEAAKLSSLMAEARSRQAGIDIEGIRLLDSRREEAIVALSELAAKRMELEEKRRSLKERLSRLDLRAPVDGAVFGSSVFAVDSVIRSAEPVMFIVPISRPLQVSARVLPEDVEQVYPGQPVVLMLSSFNQRIIPEIPGSVLRISADVVVDERSGEAFYEAIVDPDFAALEEIKNLRLIPGMPVEAFIKTDVRSPISYLVQPLLVYFSRAFRAD